MEYWGRHGSLARVEEFGEIKRIGGMDTGT
jgi:hypothetical protein